MRQERFPKMQMQAFAARLGCSRMHATSIEVGRRNPSLSLALRWLDVLGPGARLELFGDFPEVAQFRRLKASAPEFFAAA